MNHDHSHGHDHSQQVDEEGLSIRPDFDIGDEVIVRETMSENYKRRPEYAEGASGIITDIHGAYRYPKRENESDSSYDYLYSVVFEHAAIWENTSESNGSIHIDIWETTLEHV